VADYSASLLRALRGQAEVLENAPGDINLYHTGNNQLHSAIYQRAIRAPGVAVIHDAVLHHFFLGSLEAEHYIAEFVYNYGEWSAGLARDLWQTRSRSAHAGEYFRYPMLRRLALASRALIVHNPAAAALVRQHAPGAIIHEIPHLFDAPAPPEPAAIIEWRTRLGPGAFLFGIFGHLRESKRLIPALRVFSRIRRENPNAWLLVAGPIASCDLERAAARYLDQPGVLRVDYLPEPEFWFHAHAVDACINLRYPAAGETSGIAIRLMGIGKPVLVTAGEETARFPEAACIRVDAGPLEEEMLAAYMLLLLRSPDVARQIGRTARAHIAEHHAVSIAASRYLEVLRTEVKEPEA
jgi:glycosyltransferase involved in cell wall biosynthesis